MEETYGQKKTLYVEFVNTEAYYIKHIRYHNDPPEKSMCDRYDISFAPTSTLTKHITFNNSPLTPLGLQMT